MHHWSRPSAATRSVLLHDVVLVSKSWQSTKNASNSKVYRVKRLLPSKGCQYISDQRLVLPKAKLLYLLHSLHLYFFVSLFVCCQCLRREINWMWVWEEVMSLRETCWTTASLLLPRRMRSLSYLVHHNVVRLMLLRCLFDSLDNKRAVQSPSTSD